VASSLTLERVVVERLELSSRAFRAERVEIDGNLPVTPSLGLRFGLFDFTLTSRATDDRFVPQYAAHALPLRDDDSLAATTPSQHSVRDGGGMPQREKPLSSARAHSPCRTVRIDVESASPLALSATSEGRRSARDVPSGPIAYRRLAAKLTRASGEGVRLARQAAREPRVETLVPFAATATESSAKNSLVAEKQPAGWSPRQANPDLWPVLLR
jgi:hypothetical protein